MRVGHTVVLVCVLMAAAYGATSLALGAAKEVNPPFGFLSLPTTPPSPLEAIEITHLLGSPAIETRYGVTASSVAQSRILAATAAGNLYLVAGGAGACLAFTSGVACGDPTHDRLLALLGNDPTTGNAVGGGIASPDVKSVTITMAGGSAVTFPIVKGIFQVTPQAGIMSSTMLRFTPNDSLAGVAVGALGALTAAARTAQPFTATHCTRYNPGTPVDFACGVLAYNPTGLLPEIHTAGFAARDYNEIEINKASSLFLWYVKHTGEHYGDQNAISTFLIIGSSGGNQALAYCKWDNFVRADYNECTTGWH